MKEVRKATDELMNLSSVWKQSGRSWVNKLNISQSDSSIGFGSEADVSTGTRTDLVWVEESSRQLSRSDSRYGSLKRGQRQESLNEDELEAGGLDVELRALALQQEVLLFQVDCLQDALEGAEEALAETQSDTHRIQTALEREQELRIKLQQEVCSLKQELERLREERRAEQLQWRTTGPIWLHGAPEGSSVDREETPVYSNLGLHLNSLQEQFQEQSETQRHEALTGDDNEESSGYEDAPSEFSPAASTPEDGDLLEAEGDQRESSTPLPKPGDSCALS
ncbi:hypothetical protein DNTS_018590 [Danionella cerebrum]|uniref:Uncharacterized protein n=1 Tax=Danionella cerebrum TaxID=2873325 RepID=A0A553Q9J7_9TELE|nr:hypothetical protein DNTS_018590 [Danionella translucida]